MWLNIHNENERKILCVSNHTDGMMMSCSNHHLLEVGKVYTLIDLVVHDSYTEVYLKEFPDLEFNSVVFDEIE